MSRRWALSPFSRAHGNRDAIAFNFSLLVAPIALVLRIVLDEYMSGLTAVIDEVNRVRRIILFDDLCGDLAAFALL